MARFIIKKSEIAAAIQAAPDYKEKAGERLVQVCEAAHGAVQKHQAQVAVLEKIRKELNQEQERYVEMLRQSNELNEACALLATLDKITYTKPDSNRKFL